MNDLISRQAAIDAIADYLSKTTYTSAISYLNTGAMILARVPSAERKKGKWIRHLGFSCPWECSECNTFQRDVSWHCPHCGVQMEVQDE